MILPSIVLGHYPAQIRSHRLTTFPRTGHSTLGLSLDDNILAQNEVIYNGKNRFLPTVQTKLN